MSFSHRSARAAGVIAVAPALLVVVPIASATAASGQPARTEVAIHSTAPDAAKVAESYVSLYAPLPSADGTHPASCDRIGYLRYRAAGGPSDFTKADAIYVAQPGIFEGAAAFDQVARDTILDAAAAGKHVEFWALSRRSNCLEDTTGITAAIQAENPQVAFGYYFGGQAVGGHTFPGFVSESSAAWLAHVGVAQTVEDEYTVISQVPAALRTKKVLCGGHSLGGTLTAAFANWDFSGTGDPAGAGYNQCAGYFALDTRLNLSGGSSTMPGPLAGVFGGVPAAAASGSPYINVAPLTPEVLAALPIFGMAAYGSPSTRSTLLAAVPDDSNFQTTENLLVADSYANFLSGTPNARQLNATNEAVIGDIFGDVSEPLGFLRASIGVPSGGPVVEKNFPVPYGTSAQLGGLVGGNDQVAVDPSSVVPGGPLYTWLNYNQVPTPGPSPSDNPGQPYVSASSEVSDIVQFSRNLFQDAPALFTEDYFPSLLALDTGNLGSGGGSGDLAGLRYTTGIAAHPAAYVDAGEGLGPLGGAIPSGPQPQVHVVAAGYNHLDVLTAARAQNNGLPEVASSTLAAWGGQVLAGER